MCKHRPEKRVSSVFFMRKTCVRAKKTCVRALHISHDSFPWNIFIEIGSKNAQISPDLWKNIESELQNLTYL